MSESGAVVNRRLMDHWVAFQLAIQFLTSIPVKGKQDLDSAAVGRSLLYYPLVGLLLGVMLCGVAAAAAWLFSPLLTATLVVLAWVLLTGVLHIDGLADCADAWVGGFGSRERTLALMKDPTSGPVAVAVVVCLLMLKVALVSELANSASGVAFGLVLALVLARLSVLLLFLTTPYVRAGGLGEILVSHFPRGQAKLLCAVLVVLLLVVSPLGGLWILACTGLGMLWLRRLMLERLGGCTGDTVGAQVEILEVLVLLTVVALTAKGIL